MTHAKDYREAVIERGLTVTINGHVCLLERPILANWLQDADTVVVDMWDGVPVIVGCGTSRHAETGV